MWPLKHSEEWGKEDKLLPLTDTRESQLQLSVVLRTCISYFTLSIYSLPIWGKTIHLEELLMGSLNKMYLRWVHLLQDWNTEELLPQKLVKELRDISKYFPKGHKIVSCGTILAKYSIVELKVWLHKNSRCSKFLVSGLYNSGFILENHLLDLMNLPVTENQRGPSWTTHGDVLQYSPIQVWVLGHSASTSALATAGSFPRWA